MTNALRHADAQTITIRIGSDAHALLLDVVDDGRGLAQDWQRPGHFGVRGMRERARALGGELEVENRPEGGTRRGPVAIDMIGGRTPSASCLARTAGEAEPLAERAASEGMTMTKAKTRVCWSTITPSCASVSACCCR